MGLGRQPGVVAGLTTVLDMGIYGDWFLWFFSRRLRAHTIYALQ